MATKTIPQLTLRSSITDACMYEIDDGIQSYRVTALQLVAYLATQPTWVVTAMLADAGITAAKLATDSVTTAKIAALNVTAAKLDDSFISDLTAVTAQGVDYLALADASDSNKKKKVLVSGLKNPVYRSVTTTDAVGVDDELMKLSGTSFVSTLPTAVGNNKRYRFVHAGTTLTNIYTLATTSSQTIGGFASSALTMMINGEVLTVESDGANWLIVSRYIPQTENNFTTQPTNFGTCTNVNHYWYRNGPFLNMRGTFTCGTVAASEARVVLPGSLVTITTGAPTLQVCGIAGMDVPNSTITVYAGFEANKGYAVFMEGVGSGTSLLTKSTAASIVNTGGVFSYQLNNIPIAGWT